MKTISSRFFNFIRSHKVWSIIIALVIFSTVWFLFFSSKDDIVPDFVTVEKGTIKEIVSVTGIVKPFSDVDLAFERGGKVTAVEVAVGDKVQAGENLIMVSNADLQANLDQARANLKRVNAKYNEVKRGTRAEEITLQQSKLDKSISDLAQSKTFLVNTFKDVYVKADDAVRNNFYSLFNEPGKYKPELKFTTDAYLKEDIEDGQQAVEERLVTWEKALTKVSESSDLVLFYENTKDNLNLIKTLFENGALAVNKIYDGDATQTNIDSWKISVSSARGTLSIAISSLNSAYDSYKTAVLSLSVAQNELAILKAGSTGEEILSAEASSEEALAQVASAEAELAKSIIKSPINGVITSIDTKLGEIVSANKNVISVISYGDYEVESFVPEADISKVKIGNLASTTLDAYGESINFDTAVIRIDPAATVIEGVPTYKVTFRFVDKDERVRAGMTANLEILTAEKIGVLNVPSRVVYSKNGDRFVKILNADNSVRESPVKVGLRGSDAKVEIISGLREGDKVVTSI